MQKMLVAANKMPASKEWKLFNKDSKEISKGQIACKRGLKQHIKELQSAQKTMFSLSETKVDIKTLGEGDSESLDEIWDSIQANFKKTLPFVEETIEKWNSRTKLISNLQQSAKGQKGQKSSVFNATIVEQVNSLMANEQSRKKLVERTQLKREAYRVLGRGAEDL